GASFRGIAGPRKSAILKRIGAAVSLPLRPAIGVPSGRPAQTPIVTSGSYPIAQKARKPYEVPVLKASRRPRRVSAGNTPGGAGASARISLTYHAPSGPKIGTPPAGGSSRR